MILPRTIKIERLPFARDQRRDQRPQRIERWLRAASCRAMARSIASIDCPDGTGLVKKSSASALIARTVVAVSACPMRNTTGKVDPISIRRHSNFGAAEPRYLDVEQDAARSLIVRRRSSNSCARQLSGDVVASELQPAFHRCLRRNIVV